MTVFQDAAGAGGADRKIAAALCLAGLLTTLAGCAAGTATNDMAAPTAASAAAPAAPAAPAPAAPAAAAPTAATNAAAPKAPPRVLSPTEINEQCWMSTEANKIADLDKKAKYVDKCVAEKTKAQGM